VLTFELSLPSTSYPDNAHMVNFYHKALLTLDQLPGVKAAGIVEAVPMGALQKAQSFASRSIPAPAVRLTH
jgi:hypothetical protein